MPLSDFQLKVLRLLAGHRDPESYVAGSTYFARSGPRISDDIDIFHDRENRVAQAATEDASALEKAGVTIDWQRREPTFYQALVSIGRDMTKLEWVVDSDFRFYPTQKDADFGYVLHPIDLATNKIMAAAGRREPRDIVDLVTIHDTILPVGAAIWAAVEKAPGFTPEALINEIRRNARYIAADFQRVASEPPVDAGLMMQRLRDILSEAEGFVGQMPTNLIGLLFLENGTAVQPDPRHLKAYQTHAGQRHGHWPSSSEIGSAMLEHYSRPKA